MAAPSQIDILLRLVPDHPDRVLAALSSSNTPALASAADAHGYTLLHAAASYAHLPLLRALVRTHGSNVNARDEDGETALFYAESADVVACLVSELGADVGVRNADGLDAVAKWREDLDGEVGGTWVERAEELVRAAAGTAGAGDVLDGRAVNGEEPTQIEDGQILRQDRPGLVPENVQISFGTMPELPSDESGAATGVPDPEIRRMIEELAQREDIDSAETQAELRALVTQVVTGLTDEVQQDAGARAAQRRRLDD